MTYTNYIQHPGCFIRHKNRCSLQDMSQLYVIIGNGPLSGGLTVASSFFRVIVASFFGNFLPRLILLLTRAFMGSSKKYECNHGDFEVWKPHQNIKISGLYLVELPVIFFWKFWLHQKFCLEISGGVLRNIFVLACLLWKLSSKRPFWQKKMLKKRRNF